MPLGALIGVVVQVKAEVTEEVGQLACLQVQGDEDEPVAAIQPGGRQQPLVGTPESGVAAVGVLVERQPDEPAVVAVRPAVIRAAEMRRVAHLGPADLHAAVQAHVEVRADGALLIPGDDEGVLQNPADYVVAGLGDLGFVRDEHPGPAEDSVPLQREDLVVVVDVGRDHAVPDMRSDLGQVCHSHSPRARRAARFLAPSLSDR